MIVTLTQFRSLAKDSDGHPIPLGSSRSACQALTAAGAFTALSTSTRFVRLATDTALRLDIAGGSTDTADELVPAGVEYFAMNGGETLTIAVA